MQDPRLDPGRNDNIALHWATKFGHLAVADRLLRDRRVDAQVGAGGDHAICWNFRGLLRDDETLAQPLVCRRVWHAILPQNVIGELDMDKPELVRTLLRHAVLRRAHFATAVLRKWTRGRLGADTATTKLNHATEARSSWT